MLHQRPKNSIAPLVACAVVAVALHVVGAPLIAVALTSLEHEPVEREPNSPDGPNNDEEPLVLSTITEEELAEILKDPDELEPEEPEEPPPEPEEPPPTVDPLQKTVSQVNNEEAPSEANYVSDNANKVEEETAAEETTLTEALPGESVPEDVVEAETPNPDSENAAGEDAPESPDAPDEPPAVEIAMVVKPSSKVSEHSTESFGPISESWESSVPDPEAPGEADPTEQASDSPVIKKESPSDGPKKRSPEQMAKLFNPTLGDVAKIYADDPIGEVRPTRRRRKVLARHAQRQRLMKASLENMISEVKPGNHTSVNAHKAVYAGYVGAIHRRIHARWANRYLPMLDTRRTFDTELSDPTLMTKLEFVIDAESGEFESVNIVQSSGVLAFDAEAIDTSWSIGRRPNAPASLVSPNGKVYVHWSFWRDARQCGVFGASIYLVDKDGSRSKTSTPADHDHAPESGHRH